MMRRSCRVGAWKGWVFVGILGVGLGCQGWVPEGPKEGVAFRLGVPGSGRWHGERSGLERVSGLGERWMRVVSESGLREAWLSDRVAVKVGQVLGGGPGSMRARWAEMGLRWVREGAGGIQILEARGSGQAGRAVEVLAGWDGVEMVEPVMRRPLALHGGYSLRPNDPFFSDQWHLENRDSANRSAGVDLNVRAAWPVGEGANVTVAICDDGFETEHPDLRVAAGAVSALHYDFIGSRPGGTVYGSHATCVAGLVAATDANGIGVSGVAPKARLASWQIFDALGDIATDEALMDLFQNRIQEVGVQNHSWGNASPQVSRPTSMELAAISNAVMNGRSGRGVVMVRSGGNDRDLGNDTNDDGYANDPRVVAVAAIRRDGRVASYSNPGACLLVGVPSGDEDDPMLPIEGVATTDRVGSRGYNRVAGANASEDYARGPSGFSGTSASAPQVSGLVALILSVNPRLTVRDVQQVLIHSARQPVASDPERRRNGAGYEVSHNAGFGVPDAGQALRLAENWKARPALETVVVSNTVRVSVPDAGLRVWVRGAGVAERSILCEAAPGPHPDDPTEWLPLVDVGRADGPIAQDLTGKAALIQRGGNTFREKLTLALQAGARLAVIHNNTGGTALDSPGYTDFVGLSAMFISQNEGNALVTRLAAGEPVQVQFRLEAATELFEVRRPLVCEHVGLRVRGTHPRRGDLRITLVSPSGTRSVLQRRNFDTEPGPVDWTYWSTQHFYEPAAGFWRVEISDQLSTRTGEVEGMELIVRGVAIVDSDSDGLDDGWERRWFGNLEATATGDPDRDGSWNAREQVLGTDPNRADEPFRITLVPFDHGSFRLSWPATDDQEYRVRRRSLMSAAESVETILPGRFPELEWVVPSTSEPGATYQIEAVAR